MRQSKLGSGNKELDELDGCEKSNTVCESLAFYLSNSAHLITRLLAKDVLYYVSYRMNDVKCFTTM